MANKYKNASLKNVNTSRTLLYDGPAANTGCILVSLTCANIDGANDYTTDIEFYDTSANNYVYVGYKIPVNAGGTLHLDEIKLFLETDDKLYITASANNKISSIASLLEIPGGI